MNTPLNDIATQADIKILVNLFYDKVNEDDLLAPIFNGHADVNWEKHLPIMYQFWESVLLGTGTYQGNPFPKHAYLPVDSAHFTRWLHLFFSTLDENFAGPKTEEAKMRAANIARIFENKINIIQGKAPEIPILPKGPK